MKNRHPTRKAGLSLVEVVMAIGIMSFAILTLVALLPVGLKTVRESSDEAAAINQLAIMATDVKSIPAGSNASARFGIPAGADVSAEGRFYLEEGGIVQTDPSVARFLVNWRVLPAPTNTFFPTQVNLLVGWPAAATNPAGFVEALITLPLERP